MTLKIAVLAPMPSASVSKATALKPRFLHNIRAPSERSNSVLITVKDGRVRADAEREREHGHSGETRILQQHPCAVTTGWKPVPPKPCRLPTAD